MVPFKPHTLVLGGETLRAYVTTMPSRPDETTPEEALAIKNTYKILLDAPQPDAIQDAPITAVKKGNTVLEAGPIYIRRVEPKIAGLGADHVEIIAVAYREEA